MKKTAVEWLVEQMFKQGYFDGNKPLTFTNLDHLQQQAKEMEKEQIIDSFVECWKENMPDGYECKQSAEYYYNETFKK